MYQVKVFNPVNGSFKMVGPTASTMKALESVEQQACREVFKTGLMVKTVEKKGPVA